MESSPDVQRGPPESIHAIVFIALAIAGLALRIAVNNVQAYSTADESEYLRITEALRCPPSTTRPHHRQLHLPIAST